MKLLRFGEIGREKPGLLDKDGQVRDLSAHLNDITGDVLSPDGLKRIAADITANANHDLIEHAWRSGYLFGENEYTFLKQTALKRRLSDAQIAWKTKINRRILAQTRVRNRTQR